MFKIHKFTHNLNTMRRADRLFHIVNLLQQRVQPTTAKYLANELNVSIRTIYRDIQDLSLTGIPIIAEIGVGYKLAQDFKLPPLMFTENELAAITLGIRLVTSFTDEQLKNSANSALIKILAGLPQRLQVSSQNTKLYSPAQMMNEKSANNLASIRNAAQSQHKIRINYHSLSKQLTDRTVWPLGLFFWGTVWTVCAWCESRKDFRNFRVDRIMALHIKAEKFPIQNGKRLSDYIEQVKNNYSC